MNSDDFTGTGVALITPFLDGKIDFPSLEKLTKRCLDQGVDYLVVLGTTGEASTLSREEKNDVFSVVGDVINGSVPLVFGAFGGNHTADMLKWFDQYDLSKADAILSATPAYSKPSQRGLIAHYQTLSANSPLPIILYNVPGRTCVDMTVETIRHLSYECDQIVAIKEASGSMVKVSKLIKYCHPDFKILSGDDPSTLPFIACGGHGVISVLGNAMPFEFSEMVRYALRGKMDFANRIHNLIIDLHDHLYIEGNPVGIKALMSHIGLCANELRLPLVPLSSENHKHLIAEYLACQKTFSELAFN